MYTCIAINVYSLVPGVYRSRTRANSMTVYAELQPGKAANFREFRGFVAIREGFFANFGGVASLARQKRAIRESFLSENRIFHQFAQVLSLESFPCTV